MGDDERQFAMEPCLRMKRSLPQTGLKYGTTRSVGKRLTHWATRAPFPVRIVPYEEEIRER